MNLRRLLFETAIMLPISACSSHPPAVAWMADATPRTVTELALAGKCGAELVHLDGFPVVKVLTTGGCSSAIPVRRDLLLLTRHAIAGETLTGLEVDGRPTHGALVAAGTTDAWHDDWAFLRIDPPTDRVVPRLDGGRAVRSGEPVYLVGFWHGPGAASARDVRRTRRAIVETVVVEHPAHPKAPCRTAFVCVDVPHTDALRGLSGGPAVVWDEAAGDYAVIGLYRGAWQLLDADERRLVSVHLVRRLPAIPP